ncbi:zinc finger FYVE domain-containing protein 26-like [Elysia marginata]|uniref:Zinc finger FYVE domain-containing protein 26-like n=1 Tax=Elysia marginata TaxID=1093978 RepID=A0AAV4GNU3_9GAST|nr:zinc finger FYVE domain-containing protein 26-like [Elysia marginata]
MCIPCKLQKDYNHLITCPHLILEQLLMNMKADLAGQIFEKIKVDFLEIKESKLRMTQDQFNNLLSKYAHKAIEVNVVTVQYSRSRTDSLCSNSDLEASDSVVSKRHQSSEINSKI